MSDSHEAFREFVDKPTIETLKKALLAGVLRNAAEVLLIAIRTPDGGFIEIEHKDYKKEKRKANKV